MISDRIFFYPINEAQERNDLGNKINIKRDGERERLNLKQKKIADNG